MKFVRVHLSALVVALATVTAAFVNGQSSKPSGSSPGKSSAPSSAAAQNALLRKDLTWTFGAKQQHGWYIYVPLIHRLLGTNDDPASPGFGRAISKWQQKSGLTPTGVLDEQSFMSMIAAWQGARLKNREPARPEDLVTVPASEFWDPERLEELRRVERQTYQAYQRMVAAAVKDRSLRLAHDAKGRLTNSEKYLKIISAYRSREYQEQLRKQSPNAGSAGLAVNSPHFTGRALDLYVGGEPVDTNDANRALQVQTPVYRWLVRNAERFGFRPYCYEPWHWEYVK